MKWLLSLFNKNSKIKESQEYQFKRTKREVLYNGINPYIIEILYFFDNNERKKFIDDFDLLMKKSGIEIGVNVNEFHRLMTIQEEKDNVVYLFYRAIVEYISCDVTIFKGIETRTIIETNTMNNSYKNITNSTGLFIAEFNIEKKILHKVDNLDFEEKLINDSLKNLSYDNQKLDMYKTLIFSFNTIGNNLKFEYYLNKIESEYKNYDLSERMTGEVFREIGELFLSKNDFKNCLKWFELGVEVYPKLGIKRKIVELKEKIKLE